MKLFAISDLHGIHPSLVIDALGRQGFMLSDPNHVIAVAGDIVDGHGHDDALVSWLRSLPDGRLIAVKGNHDNDVDFRRHVSLSEDNAKWLDALPWTYECEHFAMAHGIWVSPMVIRMVGRRNAKRLSLWASPSLLGRDYNIWYLSHHTVKLAKTYLGMRWWEYAESLRKPTLLGHFTANATLYHINATAGPTRRDGIEYLQGGALKLGNAYMLDTDIKATGMPVFTILDFP